ncbi:MAG TPA: glycosyltransferase 87 family protein, partial [Candidatus Dormibacteraeota bacterium]|nr:glycosyltransferase 87 family protein [Candidatus Dormibacteraeota bacterium]
RVYGLRTLYEPGFRLAMARLAAVLAVVLYLARAAVQLAGLSGGPLRWDFTQFFAAAQRLAAGRDPYADFLSRCPGHHWCPGGYIFPPLLAELLRPLTGTGLLAASATWLVLSHVCLGLAVVVTWRALYPWLGGALGPLLLAAALLFLPLYQSLYFIQVGTLLLLLLALAAAAYLRPAPGDRFAAGAWLALAAVLRVTPVLLAPALLVPARAGAAEGPSAVDPGAAPGKPGKLPRLGRALPSLGGATGVAGLAGLAVAGGLLVALLAVLTPFTAEYFTTVLPRIGGGTPVLDNQSLPGLLERTAVLLGGEVPATVEALVTLAVLAVTFAVAQRAVRGAGPGDPARPTAGSEPGRPLRAGVLAAFLAALPVASSITWQHHLVSQLLVYPLLAPLLVTLSPALPGVALARRLVVLSYPLMWADRHITDAAVIVLGLAQPSGARIAPFLVLTAVNLVGMVGLWVSSLLLLSAAGNGLGRQATGRGQG